ncbi:MAG: DUF475 domain-containing protein [Methylomonas sp.]|nr:DUF475 domain-containing protein [Methylomonas sp.]PPD22069.1 MAG: hypothetical protein CTY23_03150 [Methylomonas sp.]PPD26151.1 MAG: hypothetical protein CTY22_06195 [Methylomonas sp.]PPD37866.1 MAG: hypothetical protein CTY21_06190 [Methylomonas sp.]PPD42443.1 MAG: hypothetical protein CTY17_01520 [Methylomonas sp.]
MRHFQLSLYFTLICLIAAFLFGGVQAAILALILGILEVSLSFDNAIVNASVLKKMSPLWQQRFLTWGIVIAVFGMRLVFPVLIVAFAAEISLMQVIEMALTDSDRYAQHLHDAHPFIAAFGGTFLLLVAFSFLFDEARDIYWLGRIEQKIQKLGKIDAIATTLALLLLLITYRVVPTLHQQDVLIGGISGIFLYGLVSSLDSFFESEADDQESTADLIKKGGAISFIYLEILDASFSFDGVIGAFAITRNIVIIMLGLGIGAMFVRSLTVYLVNRGTLDEYVFLEHGAHYAIGILAVIMLVSIHTHIPEVFTGLIGAVLIVLSVFSSIRHKNAISTSPH